MLHGTDHFLVHQVQWRLVINILHLRGLPAVVGAGDNVEGLLLVVGVLVVVLLHLVLEQLGVYLLEQLPLELLQLISVHILIHIVEAKQGRLCKDVLEIGQLLLEKSILSGETSILLVHLLLDFLQLRYSVLQFVLVVSLSHSASDGTLSVLQSSIRMD